MSIEQLIVLVAFVIAMLVRAAKQAPTQMRKAARAPVLRSGEVSVESEKVQAPARYPEARGAREMPRRVSRARAPAPPAPPRVDYRPHPNDAPALRRAIVLATILGPPRALDDKTLLDARDR